MNRLKLAKIGIPILIVGLLISIPYTADNKSESVEQSTMACVVAVCVEEAGEAGDFCESHPPRMSRIMIVRDGDTGARSVVVKMSDTACK